MRCEALGIILAVPRGPFGVDSWMEYGPLPFTWTVEIGPTKKKTEVVKIGKPATWKEAWKMASVAAGVLRRFGYEADSGPFVWRKRTSGPDGMGKVTGECQRATSASTLRPFLMWSPSKGWVFPLPPSLERRDRCEVRRDGTVVWQAVLLEVFTGNAVDEEVPANP